MLRNYNMTKLDIFVLEEAILLSKIRTKDTNIEWSVDHIVPVKHKLACGLNSAANIQVVPAKWNRQKGNKTMEEFFKVTGY